MHVLAAVGKFAQEIWQVVLFGKTGELAARIDSDVHQPPDTVPAQQFKKLFCRFLREADGVEFQPGPPKTTMVVPPLPACQPSPEWMLLRTRFHHHGCAGLSLPGIRA